jgi:Zn-dependent protease with chaperone function
MLDIAASLVFVIAAAVAVVCSIMSWAQYRDVALRNIQALVAVPSRRDFMVRVERVPAVPGQAVRRRAARRAFMPRRSANAGLRAVA